MGPQPVGGCRSALRHRTRERPSTGRDALRGVPDLPVTDQNLGAVKRDPPGRPRNPSVSQEARVVADEDGAAWDCGPTVGGCRSALQHRTRERPLLLTDRHRGSVLGIQQGLDSKQVWTPIRQLQAFEGLLRRHCRDIRESCRPGEDVPDGAPPIAFRCKEINTGSRTARLRLQAPRRHESDSPIVIQEGCGQHGRHPGAAPRLEGRVPSEMPCGDDPLGGVAPEERIGHRRDGFLGDERCGGFPIVPTGEPILGPLEGPVEVAQVAGVRGSPPFDRVHGRAADLMVSDGLEQGVSGVGHVAVEAVAAARSGSVVGVEADPGRVGVLPVAFQTRRRGVPVATQLIVGVAGMH